MSAIRTFSAPLAVMAAACMTVAPASAQQATGEPAPRIIVSGEGTVAAAPDMAVLSLSVLREADTARDAVSANNTAMAAVIEAMKKEGIEDRDLQTSGFSVQPRYAYAQDSKEYREPKIVGYSATNSLTVRIRDLEKTGAILDTAVTLGVNQTGGLMFTNANPEAFLKRARAAAMKDAVARAGTLAEAGGVKVGNILEISEQSFRPEPMPIARAEMMVAKSADAAVPIAGGENEYRITVNVTFAIAQ